LLSLYVPACAEAPAEQRDSKSSTCCHFHFLSSKFHHLLALFLFLFVVFGEYNDTALRLLLRLVFYSCRRRMLSTSPPSSWSSKVVVVVGRRTERINSLSRTVKLEEFRKLVVVATPFDADYEIDGMGSSTWKI
jgi:hypothetical protein